MQRAVKKTSLTCQKSFCRGSGDVASGSADGHTLGDSRQKALTKPTTGREVFHTESLHKVAGITGRSDKRS
ncbi:unnamed protein product [Protopolystoma xenopodis]|uniref:Uncharacterized protein n=1 Tax=Protopolystoma xenopodis TaxID=117903 RepID=A0A448XSN2_9PLAT|nr:unnamed protein product [Protopolystoma xenopodis]